jgi:hypothetical protein
MTDNRTQIYDVAVKYLATAQQCIDRLHAMGAAHELRLLTGRLQRLSFRATPLEEPADTDSVG